MASIFASTCWPTHFLPKWLAVFFAALALGIVLGLVNHKQPKPTPPKPSPPLRNVQVYLKAVEVYSDGKETLVPAQLWTGGVGDKEVLESYQGRLSINPKKLTPISRLPGSRLWLIFNWNGQPGKMLINPWPQSTIPYTVEFRLNRANPHGVRDRAVH